MANAMFYANAQGGTVRHQRTGKCHLDPSMPCHATALLLAYKTCTYTGYAVLKHTLQPQNVSENTALVEQKSAFYWVLAQPRCFPALRARWRGQLGFGWMLPYPQNTYFWGIGKNFRVDRSLQLRGREGQLFRPLQIEFDEHHVAARRVD